MSCVRRYCSNVRLNESFVLRWLNRECIRAFLLDRSGIKARRISPMCTNSERCLLLHWQHPWFCHRVIAIATRGKRIKEMEIIVVEALLEWVSISQFVKWLTLLWHLVLWFDREENWISSYVFSSNQVPLVGQYYPLPVGFVHFPPKPFRKTKLLFQKTLLFRFTCSICLIHVFMVSSIDTRLSLFDATER